MSYVNHGIPAGRKPKPFMSYVERTDGCWLWLGAKHGGGYGSFRHKGTKRQNTQDAMKRSGGKQWARERPDRRKFSREEAFCLRQQGMGFKSIAKRLGVDPSSVKSALERYQNA